MITTARERWYNSQNCTVNSLLNYIINTGKMRDAQIEAIKTYLFLKIGCGNKSLSFLFSHGAFNNLNLNDIEVSNAVREYLEKNYAAAALYEYACLKNDSNEQVSEKLEEQIKSFPESIDYNKFFDDIFYNVSYTDYLFSLPMGAGKTYLMAAFIYLDLYFASIEPQNLAFAHNFIIFAPSGLKSSVVPSLKTIQKFNPAWIIPEPSATDIKRKMIFEVLDQDKTAKKSNKIKNPNVQKIANHQPLSELFGLVAITNAEKVIYDRLEKEDLQLSLFKKEEQSKIRQSKELREIIGKLPLLSIFIDEVHHASAAGDSKLRSVVNKWMKNKTINSVIGFSGTPYLERVEKIAVTDKLTIGTAEISNDVYYYPLIKGIGNFLKKPIVKISDVSDSGTIIETGVREFLDNYKDTVYQDGLTAKLGIYCGSIEKCEELVYPLVSRIFAEYGLTNDAILRFHKGNEQYPQPVDSQMQFDTLDNSISKIRVVLLVQIGKEGWDCRSLTGIILSQEGDCPKNMVLQASCRCLRQVVNDMPETALIYLNKDNAEKLNSQLMEQQHISLKEFASVDNSKTIIKRYNRTAYLKLPKIDYYQLKLNYNTITIEDSSNIEAEIKSSADNAKIENIIKTTDFSMKTKDTEVVSEERGSTPATFTAWLYSIVKDSFGFIKMKQLKSKTEVLEEIYAKITYEKDDLRYFSSLYNQEMVEANIRKVFYEKRDFTTVEELIPDEASLLNISNFKSEIDTDNPDDYYPAQNVVENIVLDDKGKLKPDKKTQQMIQLAEETGNTTIAEMLKSQILSHPQKDRSFHYLPYKTDSNFEQTFLKEVLTLKEIESLGLEVYYNGDRAMTEFKIKCYKHSNGKWQYIGMYTPDFLIIKRLKGKINKAIIVETKGKIYSNDPTFKDKRKFMETEFTRQNNNMYGYDRFEYLYLEDSMSESDRIKLTHNKICDFFEVM